MSVARNPDIEDLIRARAHKIWVDEGEPEGRSETHWLRAQEELQAELAAAKPHPEIATALEPELAAAPRAAASGAGDIFPDASPLADPGLAAAKPKARKAAAPRKPRK